MYVGYDNDYFKTLGFDIRFTDVFKGELVSPINLRYMLKGEIPNCDILFVLIDTVVDRDLTEDILANIPLTTHLVYLYDNLLTDFSDGEFYKRFIKCDSDIQTYTRRTDVVPAINMILNKLKKYQVKYLVDPIFMSQDFIVTHEAIKDEEILDYDKIILINGENIGEYNIRIREALSRPFSPVTIDKMICYTPVVAKVLHPDYSVTAYDIPIYSDLVIVDKVQDSDMFNAPIYRVKYTLPSGEDIEFEIPSRGIIGLRTNVLTASQGEAIMAHRFKAYQPFKGELQRRTNGSMIAMETGTVFAYALDKLQDRGRFFVSPQDEVYAGQVVGEHVHEKDLVVNVTKAKQLTNVRASGTDDKARIIPPLIFSLEEALEYIKEDEYVEVTPKSMRMRKIILDHLVRKRSNKSEEE